jgi:hypothetical protein
MYRRKGGDGALAKRTTGLTPGCSFPSVVCPSPASGRVGGVTLSRFAAVPSRMQPGCNIYVGRCGLAGPAPRCSALSDSASGRVLFFAEPTAKCRVPPGLTHCILLSLAAGSCNDKASL